MVNAIGMLNFSLLVLNMRGNNDYVYKYLYIEEPLGD